MTTIIDPVGSPTIIYNRSGTAIIPVTANGGTQADATEIPNISGWQIVMVTTPSETDYAVKPHTGADVGSIIELYRQGGPAFPQIWPPTNQTINGSTEGPLPTGWGVYLRKVAATDWRIIANP